MLGIRRFFSPSPSGRGDYDALPLSELNLTGPSGSPRPYPPPGLRKDRPSSSHALTLRTIGLTILSTTVVFATFIFVFSHFSPADSTDAAALADQHGPEAQHQQDQAQGQTVVLSGAGGFYRDPHPIRTMLKYWEIAEREVKERGLDTCKGQLSRELIDAYVRSAVDYCHPSEDDTDSSATRITCAPVHHDDFSRWWPHAASSCVSTNLRPIKDTLTQYHARSCHLTPDGERLKGEMLNGDQKDQKFVGSDIQPGEAGDCDPRLSHWNRTMIEVPRQDQWNPFHVGEDLVTTMVSVLIAARLRPDLIDSRVQLVFADEYGMDGNHFTALWDRIGAWAPRRLVLDPWQDGECLGDTIHSINAGASLLSAMKVNHHYGCASTITWGASHYYRHLVGLQPRPAKLISGSGSGQGTTRPPLNILWLSRAKYDAWSQVHDQWNTWKEWRHVDNEPELMDRFRSGLAEYCSEAERECEFIDGQDGVYDWHLGLPTSPNTQVIRFHSIDPSVHAIENQLYLVGHSTILISPHSGALGLTLFLPPGHGHVIELQVPATVGWHHYDIMATEMGMRYDMIPVQRTVDVERVWEKVKEAVDHAMADR